MRVLPIGSNNERRCVDGAQSESLAGGNRRIHERPHLPLRYIPANFLRAVQRAMQEG